MPLQWRDNKWEVPAPYRIAFDESCIEAIERYVNFHEPMGHFLTAVVENNLSEAFCRADSRNTAHMKEWIELLYNYAPRSCWGSKEKVAEWLKGGE
jgi:hypothetical protein